MWGMSFNPTKCYVMRIGRGNKLSSRIYKLCDQPLSTVENNPYLGVLLNQDMKWSPHIAQTVKKANGILGFLRRNLKSCPPALKETAYKALVRSVLEYSATIWDPYLKKDIQALEAVQRRAARFTTGDYSRTSSVTEMLDMLGWKCLEERRRDARLALMYKVVHGLVAVPHEGHIEWKTTATRSKNSLNVKQYSLDTDKFKFSFFPRTIKEWNSLTDEVVTAKSLPDFKHKLKASGTISD